jgi:hypothetical protein
MLTVLRNRHRFHIVAILPPGVSFNATWFTEQNLVPLLDAFFPNGRMQRKEN